MEKKEFNKFHKAMIKRVAQNVAQYVAKRNKLAAEIEEKQQEIDSLQKLIDTSDAPVRELTGYGVEELVRKVVTPTDKLDKNGNIIKSVKFELIYPDTVVPVTEVSETTDAGSDADILTELFDN